MVLFRYAEFPQQPNYLQNEIISFQNPVSLVFLTQLPLHEAVVLVNVQGRHSLRIT